MENGKLDGDIAIITGAGRNVGKGIAEEFAAEGAEVAVVDIDESNAKETAQDIRDAGGEAIAVPTDVSNEADVKQARNTVESEFGTPTILVNNAAILERSDFLDMSTETFRRTVEVNLVGMFLCTREIGKSMVSDDVDGRIVNVASFSGKQGEAKSVAYGSSKGAVFNFTRSVAKALAEYGIRVNTLTPGRTGKVTMQDAALAEDDEDMKNTNLATEDEKLIDEIPLGRFAEPLDQAQAALFLVSDESSYMTGEELAITGGLNI